MNILIIGSGGREHALAWKIAQSPRADRVFVAPGNAGTDIDGENVPIAADDFPALIRFAKENEVGLTVVGPEAPLAAGIVDAFEEAGLRNLRPQPRGRRTGRQQGLLQGPAAHRPTCPRPTIRSSATPARPSSFSAIARTCRIVVKADGLAAGKGVVVCSEPRRGDPRRRADRPAEGLRRGRQPAGDRGAARRPGGERAGDHRRQTIVTLQPAQDHKAAFDGDTGPNTGGMGAYCPAPLVDDEMLHWIEEHDPGADGPCHEACAAAVPRRALRRPDDDQAGAEGAGIQRAASAIPSASRCLMRLKTDLVDVLEATVDGRLDQLAAAWNGIRGRRSAS